MYSNIQGDTIMSIYSRKSHIPTDLLNDLSSRFIINVPEEERVDLIRLCFQIELAHWFYVDFYMEEDNKLPKVSLKDFIHIIFGHIPFLQKYSVSEVDAVIVDWREYKKAVPTFGAILLDQDLKKVLLVQGFLYKTSWGFPKGKVNKDEQPHHCAIREVLEETGFDISSLIDKDVYLEHYFNDQLIRLYIITGVPVDAKFHPRTKNEIKGCEWFPVNQLPIGRKEHAGKSNLSSNNFFMVIPFVKQLKKWISSKAAQTYQEKNSNTEKCAEVDKQIMKQQQQLFAQMTKNDYARYMNDSSPSDNRSPRPGKSIFSPPPRMVRQKNTRHEDRKRNAHSNVQPSEDRAAMYSRPHRKINLDLPQHDKRDSMKAEAPEDGGHLVSKTWQNFSLDCEALIATFNISMRKTSLMKR